MVIEDISHFSAIKCYIANKQFNPDNYIKLEEINTFNEHKKS